MIANFCACLCVLAALLALSPAAMGQEMAAAEGGTAGSDPQGEQVPFNIGLVPYADINAYRHDPHNHFSLDILVGLTGSVKGMTLAGGASVVTKDVYGLQMGLVTNVVKNRLMGVQFGLVNVAGEVSTRSVQIGLVNYSKKVGNASVGLVNIHKKGKHTLDVWTTDFAIVNVGTKLGGDYVYSILGFSFQPRLHPDNPDDSVYWGPIIGLGGKIPIVNGGFLALEWLVHAMFDETPKISSVGTMPNIVQQLRLVGGYEISDLVTVYAGPAININIGEVDLWGISYLPQSASFKMLGDPPPGSIAIGFAAGVELF